MLISSFRRHHGCDWGCLATVRSRDSVQCVHFLAAHSVSVSKRCRTTDTRKLHLAAKAFTPDEANVRHSPELTILQVTVK